MTNYKPLIFPLIIIFGIGLLLRFLIVEFVENPVAQSTSFLTPIINGLATSPFGLFTFLAIIFTIFLIIMYIPFGLFTLLNAIPIIGEIFVIPLNWFSAVNTSLEGVIDFFTELSITSNQIIAEALIPFTYIPDLFLIPFVIIILTSLTYGIVKIVLP